MEYSKKSKAELIALCKERHIKGYTGKKKEDVIGLLEATTVSAVEANTVVPEKAKQKKDRGQFYTTNSSYILDGFPLPPSDIRCIVEPFAGKGDLIEWVKQAGCVAAIEAFDIEPKYPGVQKQDTLLMPPDYNNAWIITNPPYLARNKSDKKEIYDMYDTNDLYKCFLNSVVQQHNCRGGIFIIPAGFFFSPREMDTRCRNDFMSRYKITQMKYFEETVFDDTTTTIVAFSFEKATTILTEQNVEWTMLPSKINKTFHMSSAYQWIIGGDIYHLEVPDGIQVRRHVEGQPLRENETQTFITLNALDSGTKDGRICCTYRKDYIYPAKDCSRTYATLRISGRELSEEEQIQLCSRWNEFIEQRRSATWSLFLPQFRETKEYARKRIPFELAYRILLHLIQTIV